MHHTIYKTGRLYTNIITCSFCDPSAVFPGHRLFPPSSKSHQRHSLLNVVMKLAASIAADAVTSDHTSMNHQQQQHHPQRKHYQLMTPASRFIVFLLIIASATIGVSETAATGGESAVSCGTTGGDESGNRVVLSRESSQREGRSAQEADKLRSLLRMKPAEKARVSTPFRDEFLVYILHTVVDPGGW